MSADAPPAPPAQETRQPRPPSLLDAVLPVVVLIALIALTIGLFGVSATDGPLQVAQSGNAAIDQLFSRGGMSSLLTTVWLVLAALSFAAIMGHAGFLERLLRPVVARAPTRGRLILAINGSGVGLNVIAGDPRLEATRGRRNVVRPEQRAWI